MIRQAQRRTVFVSTRRRTSLLAGRQGFGGQVIGGSKKTVFVGMSGGVDSSVTAAILRDQGYNVVGVHLRCWNVDGCAAQDAEDARRAAETLSIPFYVFDFEKEYRERVVQYMVDGYKKGITPNPDVMCNQEIKFGLFYKRAMELGADFVATGHYVRLKKVRNVRSVGNVGGAQAERSNKAQADRTVPTFQLLSAKDVSKDQSYFLWTLTQKQLAHCLFPLGDLIKRTQVRKLAKKYKLPNAEKKDSQGICFLGHIALDEFLADFIPAKKGAIVNVSGKIIGKHKGAQFYTIGQRRGFGLGGSDQPLYVSGKNMKKNIIMLAPETDPSLYKKEITLSSVNLISPSFQHSNILQNVGMSVWCRVRYRQPLFKATLVAVRDVGAVRNVGNAQMQPSNKLVRAGGRSGSTIPTFKLVFQKPQKFVVPGQSAVFYSPFGKGRTASRRGGIYSSSEMLGGGIIHSAK